MTDDQLDLQEAARRHLWMHFTRLGSFEATLRTALTEAGKRMAGS